MEERTYICINRGIGNQDCVVRIPDILPPGVEDTFSKVWFVRQMTAFADSRGYLLLDQFTSADIDLFYGGVKLGARAKDGSALFAPSFDSP